MDQITLNLTHGAREAIDELKHLSSDSTGPCLQRAIGTELFFRRKRREGWQVLIRRKRWFGWTYLQVWPD